MSGTTKPPTIGKNGKRIPQVEDILHLLSKAMYDEDFRRDLLSNPAKVLDGLGYETGQGTSEGQKTVKFFADLAIGNAFEQASTDLALGGVGRAGDC